LKPKCTSAIVRLSSANWTHRKPSRNLWRAVQCALLVHCDSLAQWHEKFGETKDMHEIEISTDTIRLGQFLKLANLVDSGSDAKFLLAEGEVSVNGEVEIRRGRQLRAGDVVEFEGIEARVVPLS
jgi:ribosome-associated protein